MPDAPTFGRYAEIPYDRMTAEQQDGYRALIEARGALGGPNRIFVHNPSHSLGRDMSQHRGHRSVRPRSDRSASAAEA